MAPPRWRAARAPADLIIQTPDQQRAWIRASRLCTLYSQVVMRSNRARSCELNHREDVRAFNFFSECPQSGAFYLTGLFIEALLLLGNDDSDGGYDALWHCRWAVNFSRFLAYVKSGKIESEIGRAGIKINTWRDLRMYFTQSELVFYGWSSDKIPVVRIDPSDLWEADRDAPSFYRDRGLALPAELQALDIDLDEHDQ